MLELDRKKVGKFNQSGIYTVNSLNLLQLIPPSCLELGTTKNITISQLIWQGTNFQNSTQGKLIYGFRLITGKFILLIFHVNTLLGMGQSNIIFFKMT